jgi:DNA-directed RNA polymerase subunit M/transcription elongation factor TFIIS
MANRDIFCDKCASYVGTIRDAKLMSGLKFICPKCDTKEPDDYSDLFANENSESFMDLFKKISGKKSY